MVQASPEWSRLREVLRLATGEVFELARPRRNASTGADVGSFLRVEAERGAVLVPVTVQRRLSDLAAAGRLPAIVSTPKLRCVVIDARSWREQLRVMTDAINSGAIDPVATSVDAADPRVPRTS